MSASEVVRQLGIAQVNCAPDQDLLITVEPGKISEDAGSYQRLQVLWEMIELPTTDVYYYVYQIGAIQPELYSLPTGFANRNRWLRASDLVMSQNIVIKAYHENGILFPLSEVFIRINDDNNIIVAVSKRPSYASILSGANDKFFVQIYRNAYFRSDRWATAKLTVGKPNAPAVQCISRKMNNESDIVLFRQAVTAALALTTPNAKPIYTVAGRSFLDIGTGFDVRVGDFVDVIIDSSVKSIRGYQASTLGTYTSNLDTGMTKRLFPAINDVTTIDYKDDVDFYLMRQSAPGVYKNGIYFNQNHENCVRMVTHNAYALKGVQLDDLISNDTTLVNEGQTYVVAIVRHCGYLRGLVDEWRHLRDLYKMPANIINEALLYINSTVEQWRAEVLEASTYTELMSAFPDIVTPELVEDAFGYHAITKALCPPYPSIYTVQGQKQFLVPAGIRETTATTYDNNGLMITTQGYGYGGVQAVPEPAIAATIVEISPGNIVTEVNKARRFYGSPVVTHDIDMRIAEFRCYACPIEAGVPTEVWEDITDSDNYTLSEDGKQLEWDMAAMDILQLYPAVIIGNTVSWWEVPLNLTYFGAVRFTVNDIISTAPVWPDSAIQSPVIEERPSTIPPGNFDIFMDGYSLVEGIDYVGEWPLFVVTKKPPRTPAEGLKLFVRMYGFCNSDIEYQKPREVGFVTNGVLSADEQWAVRDNRNIRINVGGHLKLRNQVKFAEDYPAQMNDIYNGLPYAISDVIMPVSWMTTKETYAFRDTDIVMDEIASAYLTLKNEGQPPLPDNPIVTEYVLYSPFLSVLIHNFLAGWLNNGELDEPYDNVDVAGWVEPYTYLIPFDPAMNTELDMRYLYVAAHQYDHYVTVSPQAFSFLDRVIRDYLVIPLATDSRIDLARYVNIGV